MFVICIYLYYVYYAYIITLDIYIYTILFYVIPCVYMSQYICTDISIPISIAISMPLSLHAGFIHIVYIYIHISRHM